MAQTNIKPLEPLTAMTAAVRVAQLEILRAFRGRAVKVAAGLVVILVAAATAGAVLGAGESGSAFSSTARGLFPFVTMAAALLFSTKTVSEDTSNGAIHFMLMLPVPRWSVILGKYMAAAATTTSLVVIGTLLLFVGTHVVELRFMGEHLPDLGRALGGLASGSLAYTALFIFFGSLLPELPFLLSLLWVAFIEVSLGAVSLLQVASVRYHLGVIMGEPHVAGTFGTPDTPLWVALVVVGAVFVLFLTITAVVAEQREYRSGRA